MTLQELNDHFQLLCKWAGAATATRQWRHGKTMSTSLHVVSVGDCLPRLDGASTAACLVGSRQAWPIKPCHDTKFGLVHYVCKVCTVLEPRDSVVETSCWLYNDLNQPINKAKEALKDEHTV